MLPENTGSTKPMKYYNETGERLDGSPKRGDVTGWARGRSNFAYPKGEGKVTPPIKLRSPSGPMKQRVLPPAPVAGSVCSTLDGEIKQKNTEEGDLFEVAMKSADISAKFARLFAGQGWK